MNTAKDMIEAARNEQSGELDKVALQLTLDNAGIEPDQDWGEQSTTWTFDDGTAIKDTNGEIHAYDVMPNTNDTGWYLVSL